MFLVIELNNVGVCIKRKFVFIFVDICIVGLGKYIEKIWKFVIDLFLWMILFLFIYFRILLFIKREF